MTPCGELVGHGWRIVFCRAQDRIAHRVELSAAAGYAPLLESAEGSPAELWPGSPALQQVHFQLGTAAQQAALLVGMAGRSHYSASVEMSVDGRVATFEMACRVKSPPDWLGSSYRVLGQQAVECRAGGALVGPLMISGQAAPAESAPQWTLDRQRLRLAVAPPLASWPQTISWRYQLSVAR